MATKKGKEELDKVPAQPEVPHYRYFCHGCTKSAGQFAEATAGITITCPHCGLVQVTKPENFIRL